jgi:beta-ureidopropionase / N-carbamoyl-L-amino-acid hydrolase
MCGASGLRSTRKMDTKSNSSPRASDGVDQHRLWQRHLEIARFGAIASGGVNRQALTVQDMAARAALVQRARVREFPICADLIGNLFITLRGTEPSLSPVLAGSHLDTQPRGGNFDGVFGVLAAFEVLEALADQSIKTRRSVQTVVWTNEEGVRFAPGMMGSGVYSGVLSLDEMLQVRDADGMTVEAALRTMSAMVTQSESVTQSHCPPHAYLEAHIEQGPILEARDTVVGVVTGIQGIRLYEVFVSGEEGHAGTVPVRVRRDALRTAVHFADELYSLLDDPDDTLRFTIGRFSVEPGGRSTIPGAVQFNIDLRHPLTSELDNAEQRLMMAAASATHGRCQIEVRRVLARDPTIFDVTIGEIIEESARHNKFSTMRLPSGAGHDAMMLSRLCPTGMIFIPCEGGVSHNVREAASAEHMAAGAKVLADVIQRLASE